MARFHLMLDGVRILTLEDLKKHFNPFDALDRFRSGALQRWLAEQHLDDLLQAVNAIDEPSDEATIRALSAVFGLADNVEESLKALDDTLCHAESDEEIHNLFEGTDGERNLLRLEKLANEGNVAAQTQLVSMYSKGICLSKNYDKSLKNNPDAMYRQAVCLLKTPRRCDDGDDVAQYLEKAAELGHVEACDLLGTCYLEGLGGVEGNSATAAKWFQEAVKRGSANGMFHLGKCLLLGRGVACNQVEAVKFFVSSAERGCATAKGWLAYCYIHRCGVARDRGKAFQLASEAAEKGVAMGLRILGQCYENGWGVAKDNRKAAECYKNAADKGDQEADNWCRRRNLLHREKEGDDGNVRTQCQLPKIDGKGQCSSKEEEKSFGNDPDALYQEAVCLLESPESCEDGDEVAQYLERAAELGHVEACDLLGICYLEGLGGVEGNSVTAAKWFQEAVKRGSANGMFHLGKCLLLGRGVACDQKMAVKCFVVAAERGCADAKGWLAYCFLNGIGVVSDKKKVFQLASEAAKMGAAMELRILGQCYENGWGVVKDNPKAVECYKKAADEGDEVAANLYRKCTKSADNKAKDLGAILEQFGAGTPSLFSGSALLLPKRQSR